MSSLVGRERELAALDDVISEARAGSGRLVLITGEAGIGKSSLASEAMRRASAAGFRTARAVAPDDPGTPALWLWRRLARELPEVAAVLGPATSSEVPSAARFAMFESVCAALRTAAAASSAAGPSGLFLLLDDVHWADVTSLTLLRHLVIDMGDLPLIVLAVARDVPMGEGVLTAWQRLRPELSRGPGTRVLALTGLSEGEISTWLRSTGDASGWAEKSGEIAGLTGGNPFYVALVASAPASAGLDVRNRPDLLGIVSSRVSAMPAPAVALVELAAVAGDSVPPRVLAAAAHLPEDRTRSLLGHAVGAGILRGPHGSAFVHALVREAVCAGIPPDRLEILHRDVATALEAVGGDAPAGSAAEHWRWVSGPQAAAACLSAARRAAVAAAAAHATDRAVDFARLALDRAAVLHRPDGELAELGVELAAYQFDSQDLQGCLCSCLEAADAAERAGRTDVLTRAALVVRGVGALEVARVVGGLCQRALRCLPEDDQVSRSRLLAQQAATILETDIGTRGAELAAQALHLAEQTGDVRAELEAIAARHLSITAPETVEERIHLAHRAIDLGRHLDSPQAGELWGHLWLFMGLQQLGDMEGAQAEAEELGRIADRHHSPLAAWHYDRILAANALLVGDFARAHEYNERTRRLALRMGEASMLGVHRAFQLYAGIIRGDDSGLGDDTVAMLRAAASMPLVRALLVVVLARRGELAEATELFDELRGLPDELVSNVRRIGTLGQIGYAATLLGDADCAERVFQLIRSHAPNYSGDGSGVVVQLGSVARLVGDVALTAGRSEEAIELFADAVIANVRIGARPLVGLSRLGWAKALLARWADPSLPRDRLDLRAATELAAQAAAEFRRLDMPGHLAEADRLLVTVARASPDDNPLTAREDDIARLVALGRMNKEIASELFLSERTVESHVRNVLAKLGLRNRTELTRWVGERRR